MKLLHGTTWISALVIIFSTTTTMAWTAEWIRVVSGGPTLNPPRSGHVAFYLEPDKIQVFGGYAEDDSGTRYPTNDLWEFHTVSQTWKCLQTAKLWPCSSDDTTPMGEQAQAQQPQQRLAAAAATLSSGVGVLVGGWDSQQPGTGGVILNDIALLLPKSTSSGSIQWKLTFATNLGEPTSRLVAVPISDTQIILHNHRCTDHVLLLTVLLVDDKMTVQVTKQPTTGTSPSPRGLHAATFLDKSKRLVVFGGAAQTGQMSNELFVLDTNTWEWTLIDIVVGDDQEECPTPRASPCLCALNNNSDTCILFGGADRSLLANNNNNQGVPLHGCNDLWLLQFIDQTHAKWQRLTPTSNVIPPGRNAATLTPFLSKDDDDDDDSTQSFLLVGGWYPFQTTHAETYILKVRGE